MIRTEVIAWTSILLITFFAFVLMPTHERFVNVSPNAPAPPPVSGGSSSLGAPTSNMSSAPVGSSSCWDTVNPANGTFFDTDLLMQSFRKGADKWQACDPTGSGMITPSDTLKKCLSDAGVGFFSLDQAKASCVSDSTCSAVLELKNPSGGADKVYRKFYGSTALSAPPAGGAPIPIGAMAYIKKPCAGSSSISLLPSPTAAAPRIISTLGVGDPSLSGMNARYTSGIRPPSGSPWEGLRGLTEMASEVTDPAFQAATRPNPPLGTLRPTEPDTGLFGPGPNILRRHLVACTCSSQSAGCPVHPPQR